MATPEALLPPDPTAPAYALRLTFDYQGTAIRLTDSRRVEMMTPPVVAPAPQPGQSGYWIQVTDTAGRVVYHRSLHNPIAVDTEAYAPDRTQSITRVPLPTIEGQFTVLIPDLPGAQAFALLGPADPRSPSTPARELLRLDVEALRKFRPKPRAGQPGSSTPQGT